ncbi:hypothetical protein G3I60_08840 [Streptomyces sp. SID13666]|uniref:hypothetical protein n=1 Tax=unclassified Streptomyces TaxID=2593676 RepID=UPI0013BFFBAC|nr:MULTISPECIES: hypothetical protein [unclassified Streptomyces]NEA54258.1 hypothetical protein [Streptomyces sp. SID13666]NEA70353.1 hypothetical protein [Streptomyces sp. SID13588]
MLVNDQGAAKTPQAAKVEKVMREPVRPTAFVNLPGPVEAQPPTRNPHASPAASKNCARRFRALEI